MSTRFHISPETGAIGECSAQEGNCPFKGEHYPDYETAVDAAENIFSEQYGLFPGGGEKKARDVLSEYRLDGESYDNAMIHLGGIADALEWHDPNDPEWLEVKAEIAYSPGMGGALADFDPAAADTGEMTEDWPGDYYARTLVEGKISRGDLLNAARQLSATIDSFDEDL